MGGPLSENVIMAVIFKFCVHYASPVRPKKLFLINTIIEYIVTCMCFHRPSLAQLDERWTGNP